MRRKLSVMFTVILTLAVLAATVIAAPVVGWPGDQISLSSNVFTAITDDEGSTYVSVNSRGIYKYKPDGTLDTAWGTAGQAAPAIRAISQCFDSNGDILTGCGITASGLIRISADTGAVTVLIPGLSVYGVAMDDSGNLFVNTAMTINKYDSNYVLIWSKPLHMLSEIGLCLSPDGSLYTTTEGAATLQKYTSSGDLDTAFGEGGILSFETGSIGLSTYMDGYIYVGCYSDNVVKKISLDGTTVTDFLSSPSPSYIFAVKDSYIVTDIEGWKVNRYNRLYLDPTDTGLNTNINASGLVSGTMSPVTLDITSAIAAGYGVTAIVYDKATDLPVPGAVSDQAVLAGGAASLTLSAPDAGWMAGNYYIELVFTNTLQSITETGTVRVPAEFAVLNDYTVTFKADGAPDTVKTIPEGQTLTDIPPVPAKTGFSGAWDTTDFSNIRENKIVNAVYTPLIYTVTFKGWDGSLIGTQTVSYGQTSTAPKVPDRAGYTFIGWDGSLSNVTDNRTLTALYNAAPTASPVAKAVPKTGENGHAPELALVMLGLSAAAALVYIRRRRLSEKM